MLRTICCVMLCCGLALANTDYLNLMKQARAEYLNGHYAAAETALIAALRTLERSDRANRAITLAQLGDVYAAKDELSKAERAYGESLALYRELGNTRDTALLLRHLGAIYSLQRRDEDALRVLRQALKLTKTESAQIITPDVLNSIGAVYYRRGDHGKAEKYFRNALQVATTSEDFLNRAVKLIEQDVGPSHPDLTFTLASLGVLYTTTQRYAEAENQYRRALKILESDKAVFDTRIARLLHELSVMYARSGRKSEAEETLASAAVLARRNLSGHADMVDIIDDYSAALKHQGKSKEAEELRVEARRARVVAGLVISAQ